MSLSLRVKMQKGSLYKSKESLKMGEGMNFKKKGQGSCIVIVGPALLCAISVPDSTLSSYHRLQMLTLEMRPTYL